MKLRSKFFLGDSLITFVSLVFIIFAFKTFWHFETGSVVQVNFQGKTYGNFSLFQDKKISLVGREGESMIEIKNGQARFKHAPCKNQYCVQQGWISFTGQILICIPNEISIEILGKTKAYDSLNY
ncbi:NusG domain II-containing protein [Candidatus Methylopumilus planktonicus]|uniref:NusG domain II-containing protein n=1 Tax=Candidatus Methylopumilus planktonicus TaxID=1581557 RepID=UPI001674CBEB|nr:NusG domain II-containing protein [Candidatus Methylopumilus planktonicus]